MNKLFRILFGMTILSSFFTCEGALLSPHEAWKRAEAGVKRISGRNISGHHLIRTLSEELQPTLYIFDTGGKYVVLSADDETVPVLGYSDGRFNVETQVPAFEAWLSKLSKEVEFIRSGEESPRLAREKDLEEIPVLCQTKWSQDAPYNDLCPQDMKAKEKCVTGCVATAMAQVMKYHNWPDNGTGNKSYKWPLYNYTLKIDFSKQNYDWAKMLDTYIEGEYSEEEGQAVATIMKSCGYSVSMNYSATGSGAASIEIAGALGNTFNYDKRKIRYLVRDFFTLENWENIIHQSLKEDGPVILDGQSKTGGHSFVCDGYDKDGYFHINWGWGGLSDGYYLLSMLDPYNQGIGGSEDNSGFNYMQDAIVGISPARDESGNAIENGSEFWCGHFFAISEYGLDTETVYEPGELVGPLCERGVYNYGPANIYPNTAIGLIFRDKHSENYYIYPAVLDQPVGIGYGFVDLELPLPEEIPDGEYAMTLSYYDPHYNPAEGNSENSITAYSDDKGSDEKSEDEDPFANVGTDQWIDVVFPYWMCSGYDATVKDGEIRFTEFPVDLSSVSVPESVYNDGELRYFNLQGIELQSPVKGEVMIVRKGAKTYKSIFNR